MLHFTTTILPSLYVDPGSGALLWQSVCAIIAGAAFSLRGRFKFRKDVPLAVKSGEDDEKD